MSTPFLKGVLFLLRNQIIICYTIYIDNFRNRGNTMTDDKYIQALRNNPYGICNIPNPIEAMQLVAVEQNGMLLGHIKNPTEAVVKAALNSAPRSIQFVENPSKELLEELVRNDWAILEYIQNPSEELATIGLAQSGWALKYINNPSEELQLKGVRHNYDALQYIESPSEVVQLAGVNSTYQALRYIKNPTRAVMAAAVKQDPQAMRFISNLDIETALYLFGVSSLVIGYIPTSLGIKIEAIVESLISTVSADTADDQYIRHLIHNGAFSGRQASWPIDIMIIIEIHGTKQVKQIAIDEWLAY